MSKVTVPVSEVAELLGLPPDTDKNTVERELAAYTENLKTAARADGRAVAAAIVDGRIPESRGPFWLNALAKDPSGNAHSLLASLAPITRPGGASDLKPAVDAETETVFAKITGQQAPLPPAPHQIAKRRTVSASVDDPGAITVVREIASGATEASFAPTVVERDAMNARINADPGLQRIAWAAGIRDGIEPPPVQYRLCPEYDKPWDPAPKLVMHRDGTGHWENPEPDPETLTTRGSTQGKGDYAWPYP